MRENTENDTRICGIGLILKELARPRQGSVQSVSARVQGCKCLKDFTA